MSIDVLLADDHKVVADGLEVLLNSEVDIRVVGKVVEGHEAVQRVRELKPDMVIMDINMPGLDGIEATRQIVEINPATRVIILSMYAHNELIFRALQAGAKGYLLKESAGIEVVDAVRSVHADCRYMSRKIADEVIDDYIRLRKDSDEDHPLSRLSPREREVLKLIVEGRTRTEIAGTLSLSKKTVDTYRSRIMRKLEVDDIPTLVRLALRQGLITLE